MAEEKPKQGESKDGKKAEAGIPLVALRHKDNTITSVSFGGRQYDVEDGTIAVLPEHVRAAMEHGWTA